MDSLGRLHVWLFGNPTTCQVSSKAEEGKSAATYVRILGDGERSDGEGGASYHAHVNGMFVYSTRCCFPTVSV